MMLHLSDSRAPAALALSPSGGMVARVKWGLCDAPRAVSGLPGSAMRMSIKLRASVAEFLLSVTFAHAAGPRAHLISRQT